MSTQLVPVVTAPTALHRPPPVGAVAPTFACSTEDEWQTTLAAQYEKTVVGILDFGRAVYDFKGWCETKSGGSTFGRRMKEWRGWSPGTSSQWARIGENYDKLFQNLKKLPATWTSIYEISGLPNDVIEQEITPDTVYEQVRVLKVRLGARSRRVEYGDRTKLRAELDADHLRIPLEEDAVARGIDPDPDKYPTNDSLRHAIDRVDHVQLTAEVLQRLDNVDPTTEVHPSALHELLALPLLERLEWMEQRGLLVNANPCIVLGTSYGQSAENYNALCNAAVVRLRLDRVTDDYEDVERAKQLAKVLKDARDSLIGRSSLAAASYRAGLQ